MPVRDAAPPVFEAENNRLVRPTHYLRDVIRHRTFLAYWVRRNIVTRYRQTTIGPLWALLNPLLSGLVYAFVFDLMLRVQTPPVPYALFVVTNLVMWSYSSRTLMTGPSALIGNLELVTRVRFPREFLPIGVWLESVTDLLLSLVVVALFYWYYHVPVTPYIFLALVVFVVHTLLTLGLTFLIAAASITVRDLTYIVPLLLQLALYVAPIVYPLQLVPEGIRNMYLLNPFGTIFAAYQETLFLGRFTLGRELTVCAAMSLVMLIVGYRLLKQEEWKLADLL